MKLKDIIIRVAEIVGLDGLDVAVPSAQLSKLKDCANNIYSELVLSHVPLRNKERVNFVGGKAFYEDFGRKVREILRITHGGVRVPFTMYPTYVEAEGVEGEAEVEYLFHGEAMDVEDEVILPPQYTEYVLAMGVASEYYYRIGFIDEAEFYKSRYDAAVINLSRRLRPFAVPVGRRLC